MTIEENIKQLIIERHISVKNFAKTINIPYTTLITMLNNGIGKSSVDNVIKMCKALNLNINELAESHMLKENHNVANACLLEEIKKKHGILVAEIVEKTKDLSPIQQAKVIGYLDNMDNNEFRPDSANKVS